MIRERLSSYKSLRVDDGITGSDMSRPGFLAVLRDVEADRSISHILVYRRDRLARPEDALKMASLERDIRQQGVTFVFENGIAKPLDSSNPDLGDDLKAFVEYFQSGDDLRKLAGRILDVQKVLAIEGFSTGGNAPYGWVRVLVDRDGNEVMELPHGRKIREPGCHVRHKPKDMEKIAVWLLILDLKHRGHGGKRIAHYLNSLNIPSPGSGQVRKDQGVAHRVSGKWCPGTVLSLCSNAAILGIKEYGVRSEGKHRRIGERGARSLSESDRNARKLPKVIFNDPQLVVRAQSGADALYEPTKWEEIQRDTKERGKSQRGIPRASDPSKYPLSCRVVDLTDGCGSIFYAHTVGKRRVYSCGRYLRTAGAECHKNSVDAEALLRLTLRSLGQIIIQAGGTTRIRAILEERAKSSDSMNARTQDRELELLAQNIKQLRADKDTIGRRMSSESDEQRYQFIAAEFDRISGELRAADSRLIQLHDQATPQLTAEQEIEAAMSLIMRLDRVIEDPTARSDIGSLLAELQLWIGLDFADAVKGQKRIVRRLSGGVIVFGEENLPVRLHGNNSLVEKEENQTTEAVKTRSNSQDSITADSQASDEKSSLPCPSVLTKHHQESISFTKVNRGDRTRLELFQEHARALPNRFRRFVIQLPIL